MNSRLHTAKSAFADSAHGDRAEYRLGTSTRETLALHCTAKSAFADSAHGDRAEYRLGTSTRGTLALHCNFQPTRVGFARL